MAESTSPSDWHSIRPWTPHLTLAVREITSVSATFVLSSTLAHLGLALSDDCLTPDEQLSPTGAEVKHCLGKGRRTKIISDTLATGLSVAVNGSPWKRFLIRMDDTDSTCEEEKEGADEAVIVIYGLMPGRQYDVDLGLTDAQGGAEGEGLNGTLRGHVVTEHETVRHSQPEHPPDSSARVRRSSATSTSAAGSGSASDSAPASSSSTPQNGASTSALPAELASAPIAMQPAPASPEEHLAQLTHALSQLTAERTALAGALKAARRDAAKADAALRAEIDALRRAAEKAASAEARARQRVRALGEAVRRAESAAESVRLEAEEVEAGLPALQKDVAEREARVDAVRKRADEVRTQRERVEEDGRKRLEGKRGELERTEARRERLEGKREKLEGRRHADGDGEEEDDGGTIGRLERELEALRVEIARVESEPQPLPEAPYSPPRKRHPHPHPNHPGPIQRPAQPPRRSRLPNASAHTNASANAHVRSSTGPVPNSAPFSSPATGSGTTLSSRAPPFEPRRTMARASLPADVNGKWARVVANGQGGGGGAVR